MKLFPLITLNKIEIRLLILAPVLELVIKRVTATSYNKVNIVVNTSPIGVGV